MNQVDENSLMMGISEAIKTLKGVNIMGAGSNIATQQEHKNYYEEYHPQKKHKKCYHYFLPVKEIGVCHFLNTGKPYEIIECIECKAQRVREL